MLLSVFFKEIYKIRWMWLMVLLLNLVVAGYVCMASRRLFILDHPEIVWYRVMHLGQIHFGTLKALPLVTGILVACIQFLPEMWGQRLRLCLHLPISPHVLILYHIWVGLAAFVLAVVPVLGALWWISWTYFPFEAMVSDFLTFLPWCFAGLASYLGGALAMLEPNFRLKTFNVIISAGVAGLFLRNAEPGAYAHTLWVLLLFLGLMVLSVLLPAYRFRYRRAS